jgi:hypothetical protein
MQSWTNIAGESEKWSVKCGKPSERNRGTSKEFAQIEGSRREPWEAVGNHVTWFPTASLNLNENSNTVGNISHNYQDMEEHIW